VRLRVITLLPELASRLSVVSFSSARKPQKIERFWRGPRWHASGLRRNRACSGRNGPKGKGKNMNTQVLTKIASTSLLAAGLLSVTAFSRNPDRVMADRGTIDSVNTANKVLEITEAKSKQPQTFSWNQDTRFLERDHLWNRSKPIMADQLRPGEPVRVRYQKQNAQLVAKTVVISHAKKAAASAYQPHS
jgi:hypothetical protein